MASEVPSIWAGEGADDDALVGVPSIAFITDGLGGGEPWVVLWLPQEPIAVQPRSVSETMTSDALKLHPFGYQPDLSSRSVG